MRIVGSKELFAIQWNIVEYIDSYCYGNFCFWIANQQVGNYNEISTLSIISSYLRDFLKNDTVRSIQGSQNLTKEKLFYLLYEQFFNGSSNDKNKYGEMGRLRDIFWLDEVGEYCFRDKIGMILLNENTLARQRLIWQNLESHAIFEAFIPANSFDMVARTFLQALDEEIMFHKQ